jgi:4-aminobutyrate aminotransferase-like enzyme
LLDQLKNATAEQKKAILDQMQAQQKDLLDAQRALGRQIRDELRKLRQSQPAGGNR